LGSTYRCASHIETTVQGFKDTDRVASILGAPFDHIEELTPTCYRVGGDDSLALSQDRLYIIRTIVLIFDEGFLMAPRASPDLYSEGYESLLWRTTLLKIVGDRAQLSHVPAAIELEGRKCIETARRILETASDPGFDTDLIIQCVGSMPAIVLNLGKRFFVTKKGYFGLAPPHAQVGDAIYIFGGISMPSILRPLSPPNLPGDVSKVLKPINLSDHVTSKASCLVSSMTPSWKWNKSS
jgi:hypothetical protein